MMNKISYFVLGMIAGAVLAKNYEEELDDLYYGACRCCKKAKKKMRSIRSYMD